MNEYGLVFTGQSDSGGYGIGVWKAIKQLDLSVKTVVAASNGALNAALVAQNDIQKAEDFWTSISTESIIKVESQIAVVEEEKKKNEKLSSSLKNAVKKGALDLAPINEFLRNYIDEDKIRRSEIDFGIINFSGSENKPVKVFKKDIPEGELLNYIVLSMFNQETKLQENNNAKNFEDEIYNKGAVGMLFDRKIKNIIVVDMSDSKQIRKVEKKDANIVYIKCSDNIKHSYNVDEHDLYKNINLGYNDTLKAFGKLFGNKYYIMPDDKFENKHGFSIDEFADVDFKKFYSFLGLEWTGKAAANNRLIVDKIKRTMQQHSDKNLNSDEIFIIMTEIAAELLSIDRTKIYTLEELVKEVSDRYKMIIASEDYENYIKGLGRLINSRNQLEFDRELKKTQLKFEYILSYKPFMNINDEAVVRFRRFIAVGFPKLLIANMFISLITRTV